MRYLLGLLLGTGMPLVVDAQPKKNGEPFSPEFMVVSKLDAANDYLVLKITQIRQQEIQELAITKGVTLKSQMVWGPSREERYLKLSKCKVQYASGKVIPHKAYAKQLKPGTVLVSTMTGRPPAKVFLNLLRPETLIVIAPERKLDPRIKLPPAPSR